MPFKYREVRGALTHKLGLELDVSFDHPVFAFWHDGMVIAKTHMSHGSGREVSDSVVSAMARQLGVTGPQLRGSIDCRISPESFAELVLDSASR